jgi:GrpB-like predicted nucleotidyltransferase (UPF0157 family)
VAHDPAWADRFSEAAHELAEALGALASVHHIGSTAVPGLHAKPIIDLLVATSDLAHVDARTPAIVALGYEALGEYGLAGRRYFRRDDEDGERTHHLHVWRVGDPALLRHLAFRDYLLAHPDVAAEYGALKRRLAERHAEDIESYIEGKDAFVKAVEADALAWQAGR